MVTCFTHGTALDGEKGRELDVQDRWSEMPGGWGGGERVQQCAESFI